MSDAEYVCTLRGNSLQKAREELGEDPDERLGAVQTLREWAEREQWINAPTDTQFLLAFLRCSKFSQLAARERLSNFLGILSGSYNFMNGHDPAHTDSLEIIRRGYLFVLPGRDDHGCATLVMRPEVVDTSGSLSHKDYTRAIHSILDSLVFFDENVQVNGINFLVDFGDVSMNFLTWVGIDGLKRTAEMVNHSYPARIKYTDYYQIGPVFEAFIALFKPLLSEKIQNRITIHHTMVSVYEKIEKSRLPVEYLPDDYTGPSAGNIKDIIEQNIQQFLLEPTRRAFLKDLYSGKYPADLSKRPKNAEAMASFRKLNVS